MNQVAIPVVRLNPPPGPRCVECGSARSVTGKNRRREGRSRWMCDECARLVASTENA